MARPFSAVTSAVQWRACVRTNLTLDVMAGRLELAHVPEPLAPSVPPAAVGIALDEDWNVYRALPDGGGLVRLPWAPLGSGAPRPVAEKLALAFEHDFKPTWLALDRFGLLYVASDDSPRVFVVDPRERSIVFELELASPPRSLARVAGSVHASTAAGVLLLDPRQPPVRVTDASVGVADRVAGNEARGLVVLQDRATEGATLHWLERNLEPWAVPWATELVLAGDGTLLVARAGSTQLRRFAFLEDEPFELAPLDAPGYDGRGLVAGPGAAIGYFTVDGDLRAAAGARLRRSRTGYVATYALDAGQYQARWGVLRVEACIPRATRVRVRCVTEDEPEATAEALAGPLTGVVLGATELLTLEASREDFSELHRRETPVLPWATRDDELETYEAPVTAKPGRYLWVILELEGDGRHTPRIGAIRVERSSHVLLRRLPRAFSRDEAAEGFLHRYLMLIDGMLSELEDRAAARHLLLDPRVAPADALPFIASFLGVMFDARLDEAARRRLLGDFETLCRKRGTPGGIARLVELVLGVSPVRVLEDFEVERVTGTGTPHHFRVLVPAALAEAELGLLRDLVAAACPAHTSFDIEDGSLGMVLGGEIYTGLTTILSAGEGGQAAFGGAVLGSAALDRPRPPWLDPWPFGGGAG